METSRQDLRLIDISPTISPNIAVFPGDQGFLRHVALDMKQGAALTLSSIQTTVHLGAHADAPCHYNQLGEGIHTRSLDFYFGPCQVLDCTGLRDREIKAESLMKYEIAESRVLVKTNTFLDPSAWTDDFAFFAPEAIAYLAAKGVRLIGIDTPSVDKADAKVLQSHQIIYKHDMAILEGLVLEHVQAGNYLLIALPLKLENCDAAPVRAALLPRP